MRWKQNYRFDWRISREKNNSNKKIPFCLKIKLQFWANHLLAVVND